MTWLWIGRIVDVDLSSALNGSKPAVQVRGDHCATFGQVSSEAPASGTGRARAAR